MIFDHELLVDVMENISKPIILNPFIVLEVVENNPMVNEEYTINGFITNPDIKSFSTRNLHSLDLFRRGDTFQLDNGNHYMVIDDVLEKRGAKYKSEVRFCNHRFNIITTVKVKIGQESNGKPIYEYIDKTIGYTYSIFELKAVSEDGGNIITDDSKATFTIRDNKYNRENIVVNDKYTVDEQAWTIRSRDFTKEGLIILTAERTTSSLLDV